MNYWDTSHKRPIKDLARLNNKWKNIEVLVNNSEYATEMESTTWDRCRKVARFADYSTAHEYAVMLADLRLFWVGGVLIR